MTRLKNNSKNLEKENLSLKEIIDTRKKDFINRCISLVTENTTLNTKVQNLEKSLNNFSRGEKSFNMLLGNQIFANNGKGLGFGKTQVDDNAKGRSTFARCEIIGHLLITVVIGTRTQNLIKSIQCAQFVENLDTIKIVFGIDPNT